MVNLSRTFFSILALSLIVSAISSTFAEDEKKPEAKQEDKAAAAKTTDVEIKGVTLKIPEAWKKMPLGPLQVANYEVPAAGDDAEPSQLAVFHFQNGAGSLDDNMKRYVNQFDAGDRKVKVLDGESPHGKYTLVDITGSWTRPFQAKAMKKPNTRMLAVILHNEKSGDYFVRLTGPNKTVTENAAVLRASISADAEKEKVRKE